MELLRSCSHRVPAWLGQAKFLATESCTRVTENMDLDLMVIPVLAEGSKAQWQVLMRQFKNAFTAARG